MGHVKFELIRDQPPPKPHPSMAKSLGKQPCPLTQAIADMRLVHQDRPPHIRIEKDAGLTLKQVKTKVNTAKKKKGGDYRLFAYLAFDGAIIVWIDPLAKPRKARATNS